jgi:hypothetical protein
MTQVAGLLQAQPITLPRRTPTAPPQAITVPAPRAAARAKKKKAASAKPAAVGPAPSSSAAAEPAAMSARGAVFEGAIQELLKSKRNRLTPAVAEQILKLLLDL